jgi:hypothetical protein
VIMQQIIEELLLVGKINPVAGLQGRGVVLVRETP